MNKRESHIAKMIGERINKIDPKADVILFGSHAGGNATEESDWDVLVLIDNPKINRSVEAVYRDEMFLLELELGEPISTFIYSKKDWETKYVFTPLYTNIKKEGVKLR